MPRNLQKDLTDGAVGRTLFLISAPMMMGVSTNILVQMVEIYFIGQLGTKEIAAVTFAFPLTMALSSIALGISIGTSSVIARGVGQGGSAEARQIGTHALLLVATLMTILSFLGWLLIDPVFTRIGASPETLKLIRSYLNIIFASFPLMTVMMVGGSIMRAHGNANIPGAIMTGSALIQLALGPVLIFGLLGAPRLELEGAAWAAGLARGTTCLVILFFVIRYRLAERSIDLAGMWNSCKQILQVGLPAMATQLIGPVSAGIITALLATHGESVVAGFGIASRIEAVSVMLLFALSGSIGPFVGQNWGAQRKDRVNAGVNASYRFSLAWGILVFGVLSLFGSQFAALVDDNAQAIVAAGIYLSIVPLSYGLWGVLMMTSASFNALGKPIPSTVLAFTRMFVIYVPLALLFNHWFGFKGIFLATALANIAVGLAGYFWFRNAFFPRMATPG